jgi:hypothetical protein
MTVTLYATPYERGWSSFFRTAKEFKQRMAKMRNANGEQIRTVQISFAAGEDIDEEVFDALKVEQDNFEAYLKIVEELDFQDKIKLIIKSKELGDSFKWEEPCQWDIDIYEFDSLEDLAINFVEAGLFGKISKELEYYLDYSKIARYLLIDYCEINILGKNYIYIWR